MEMEQGRNSALPDEVAFFDANILVYTDDSSAYEKQQAADGLFHRFRAADRASLSVQVLQEYFNTVTRKLGVDPELAQRKVELLAQARLVRFDGSDAIASIELHRLYRISFWDALIVHAARMARASILYTEDMQHGATIAGVRIVNPFLNL